MKSKVQVFRGPKGQPKAIAGSPPGTERDKELLERRTRMQDSLIFYHDIVERALAILSMLVVIVYLPVALLGTVVVYVWFRGEFLSLIGIAQSNWKGILVVFSPLLYGPVKNLIERMRSVRLFGNDLQDRPTISITQEQLDTLLKGRSKGAR